MEELGTELGIREDREATGRPTESTNLDLCELPETESPTKDGACTGPKLPAHT